MSANDRTIIVNNLMQADVVSDPIQVTTNVAFSLQATWTGSPVGNFFVETSDDSAGGAPVNWSSIGSSTFPAASTPSPLTYAYSQRVSFNWIRFHYTRTSGSGVLNVTFNGR